MSADSGLLVVNVIDGSSNDNGYLARCRQKHPNHLACHDVQSMVQVVVNHVIAQGGMISQLHIFGPGHEGSQAVGGGRHPHPNQKFWVDDKDGKYTAHNCVFLTPLRDYMTSNAMVLLHGCDVAAASKHGNVGLTLLRHLSDMWGGVRVYGAVFDQYAHKGGGFHDLYVSAQGQKVHFGGLDQYALTKP
ncbi:MAG TPA: hypothetical protein VMS17_21855 [Gemmataceae bacterium]|nr:hypothetical protein [Gemmataceae bacterium]